MRRVIGIIYIDKTDLKTVKFAHLSFWGKRKELLVNIDDIKFFSDTSQKETANYLQKVMESNENLGATLTKFKEVEED